MNEWWGAKEWAREVCIPREPRVNHFITVGGSGLWNCWGPGPPPTRGPRGSQNLWGATVSLGMVKWAGYTAALNEHGFSLHIFLTFGKCNGQKSDL